MREAEVLTHVQSECCEDGVSELQHHLCQQVGVCAHVKSCVLQHILTVEGLPDELRMTIVFLAARLLVQVVVKSFDGRQRGHFFQLLDGSGAGVRVDSFSQQKFLLLLRHTHRFQDGKGVSSLPLHVHKTCQSVRKKLARVDEDDFVSIQVDTLELLRVERNGADVSKQVVVLVDGADEKVAVISCEIVCKASEAKLLASPQVASVVRCPQVLSSQVIVIQRHIKSLDAFVTDVADVFIRRTNEFLFLR